MKIKNMRKIKRKLMKPLNKKHFHKPKIKRQELKKIKLLFSLMIKFIQMNLLLL